MDFSYTAVKNREGQFDCTLSADGAHVASTTAKNAKNANGWAQAAALEHRRSNLKPSTQGEQHTVFGSFEL